VLTTGAEAPRFKRKLVGGIFQKLSVNSAGNGYPIRIFPELWKMTAVRMTGGTKPQLYHWLSNSHLTSF